MMEMFYAALSDTVAMNHVGTWNVAEDLNLK